MFANKTASRGLRLGRARKKKNAGTNKKTQLQHRRDGYKPEPKPFHPRGRTRMNKQQNVAGRFD